MDDGALAALARSYCLPTARLTPTHPELAEDARPTRAQQCCYTRSRIGVRQSRDALAEYAFYRD